MSTTWVYPYDRLAITRKIEDVRDIAYDRLLRMQGDCDKAGDVEDSVYYQGHVDALESILLVMTFPQDEEHALTCQHDNKVWFGNECGLCDLNGYSWKDPEA